MPLDTDGMRWRMSSTERIQSIVASMADSSSRPSTLRPAELGASLYTTAATTASAQTGTEP